MSTSPGTFLTDRDLLALSAKGARDKNFALWVYSLRALGLDYSSLPIHIRAGAKKAKVTFHLNQAQSRAWCEANAPKA